MNRISVQTKPISANLALWLQPNWANRTIFTGDNLDIMRGMNSETVDLIYLDPPFNSNKQLCSADRLKGSWRSVQGHMDTLGLRCGLDGANC